MLTHTLHDWRDPAAIQPFEEPLAEPVAVTVALNRDRIDVSLPDGRLVWIEVEGAKLRVHCYDGETDAPIDVDILPGRAAADDGDYLDERRASA